MEIWKEIEGYLGCEISNQGRVKQDDKLRPLYKNKDGYMVVNIGKRDKRKQFRVNRLVATAFISNPENKPQVNHKNSVRCDDRVENLEWSTSKENIQHSLKEGNRKALTEGISQGMINIMNNMREDYNYSYSKIGRTFGLHHHKVIQLLKRHSEIKADA
jgi:hypothetical protein